MEFPWLLLIFISIIIPLLLAVIGIMVYHKNEKLGKKIWIFALIYSIVALGVCEGFGF